MPIHKITDEQRAKILELHESGPEGQKEAILLCRELGVSPHYGSALAWKKANPALKKREGRVPKRRRKPKVGAQPVTA